MYTNINPTATEPWRQLVEVLKFHENETIRFHIESKDGSMFIAQTIPNMKHGEYEGHEKLGHIISISSIDIEHGHANITLHKENIIKVKSTYFLEEIVWRKDGFEVECKNDIKITMDVLD
ncbi:hypothetical protein [Bacillus cereus group sp. MYBK217-2]|uniref:hypothetical protein n=1 Tax=Bacillus cereus group sp. MYBK217-2 TaxID=3450661 RepID=UPI003F799763